MALNPSNSSNFEQLALKGLNHRAYVSEKTFIELGATRRKLVKCGKSAVARVARVSYSSGRNGTQNVSVGLLKLISSKCINKRISSLNI